MNLISSTNKYIDETQPWVLVKDEEKVGHITIDDVFKVQLKLGKVLECEKVEKTDKLLLSTIEIGKEKRKIVSGIAKSYSPENL